VREVVVDALEEQRSDLCNARLGHHVAGDVAASPAELPDRDVEGLVRKTGGVEGGGLRAGDPLLAAHRDHRAGR